MWFLHRPFSPPICYSSSAKLGTLPKQTCHQLISKSHRRSLSPLSSPGGSVHRTKAAAPDKPTRLRFTIRWGPLTCRTWARHAWSCNKCIDTVPLHPGSTNIPRKKCTKLEIIMWTESSSQKNESAEEQLRNWGLNKITVLSSEPHIKQSTTGKESKLRMFCYNWF